MYNSNNEKKNLRFKCKSRLGCMFILNKRRGKFTTLHSQTIQHTILANAHALIRSLLASQPQLVDRFVCVKIYVSWFGEFTDDTVVMVCLSKINQKNDELINPHLWWLLFPVNIKNHQTYQYIKFYTLFVSLYIQSLAEWHR